MGGDVTVAEAEPGRLDAVRRELLAGVAHDDFTIVAPSATGGVTGDAGTVDATTDHEQIITFHELSFARRAALTAWRLLSLE